MFQVRPIKSEADYRAALARVDALMDAPAGSPEEDELDVIATLVEAYEEKHFPMDLPSPVAAIQFRMEQEGLTPRELEPYIGASARVSEILSGKRPLTLAMIRALNKHLGIPAEVLIQEPGGVIPEDLERVDWSSFPISEMVERKWVRFKHDAERAVRELIDKAGGFGFVQPAFRKNDGARRNAKMDSAALTAWCLHVLAEARSRSKLPPYRRGAMSERFLRELAKLSVFEDGPKRAVERLAEVGVAVVVARHLQRTHLDGAAMMTPEKVPVVGLTLRYDRLDNFWFCLMHELAHVSRHLDGKRMFIDDLSLSASDDAEEEEADQIARDALIEPRTWASHAVREKPSIANAINLASEVQVHPAIVAGRVRFERGDYKVLSQLLGSGEVRRHFSW